jgi:hypothetical protein
LLSNYHSSNRIGPDYYRVSVQLFRIVEAGFLTVRLFGMTGGACVIPNILPRRWRGFEWKKLGFGAYNVAREAL